MNRQRLRQAPALSDVMPLYTTGVGAENALGACTDCSEGRGSDVVEKAALIGEKCKCEWGGAWTWLRDSSRFPSGMTNKNARARTRTGARATVGPSTTLRSAQDDRFFLLGRRADGGRCPRLCGDWEHGCLGFGGGVKCDGCGLRKKKELIDPAVVPVVVGKVEIQGKWRGRMELGGG